jgi:hypothetical protein
VLSTALPPGVSLPSAHPTPINNEDEYLKTLATSSINNLFDADFTFNDGFGINAIRSKRFDILTNTFVTADVPTDFDIMPSIQCQYFFEFE